MYAVCFSFFLSAFFSQQAAAQQAQIEATELAQIFNGLEGISALNKPSPNSQCNLVGRPIINGRPVDVTTCFLNQQDMSGLSVFKFGPYDLEKSEAVPEIFSNAFPDLDRKKDPSLKRVYFMTVHRNDNMVMVGLAGLSESRKGDDNGFTTGTTFEIGGEVNNTYDIRASMSGNLYSRYIPGTAVRQADNNVTAEQLFKNETIWQLFVSNARSGKLKFWNAEAGMINISSQEHFGFVDGTWQQRHWHNFLNKIQAGSAWNFTNRDDGEKDKWGAFIGAMVGLQKNFELGGRCSLKLSTSAGARVSNIGAHNQLIMENSADFRARLIGRSQLGLTAQNNTRLHSGGVLNESSLRLALHTRPVELGLNVTTSRGRLQRLPYNDVNETTGKIDNTFFVYMKFFVFRK